MSFGAIDQPSHSQSRSLALLHRANKYGSLLPFPMSTLGFRVPQFSQDLVWLPDCLQQHETDISSEHTKQSQVPLSQVFKDLSFPQRDISTDKDQNEWSREEGRYGSCHLFLSGEGSESASLSQSPGHVFHLNLHLSSDVGTLCCPTQNISTSCNQFLSNKVTSLQLAVNPVGCGEKSHPVIKSSVNEPEMFPSSTLKSVKNSHSESPMGKVASARQDEERPKANCLKDVDMSDSVELSISASEALIIYDIAKQASISETLPTAALLEAALWVKQARLEGSTDDFSSQNDESDHSLSDLDDNVMADAFEDVGLSYSTSNAQHVCSLPQSCVKDNPISEIQFSSTELKVQHAGHDNISSLKKLEENMHSGMRLIAETTLESLAGDRQNFADDPVIGSNICKPSMDVQPKLLQRVQKESDVMVTNKKIGLTAVGMTSSLSESNLNSPPNVENTVNFKGENLASHKVEDKFRSRWLGGWRSEYFDGETSFLSESADIAPDENSFVQKFDLKFEFGLESIMPSEILGSTPDEGILHSQVGVKCSSLSLDDPLCSLVPCSLLSGSANCMAPMNKENDTEKCVSVTPEVGVGNVHIISDQNVEYYPGDGHIVPSMKGTETDTTTQTERTGKNCEQTSQGMISLKNCQRKNLKSLVTYSRILPNLNSNFIGEFNNNSQSISVDCNRGLLSTVKDMRGTDSLDKQTPAVSLPLSSSKCIDGKTNLENHKIYDKRAAYEGDFPVEISGMGSPVFLKHMRTRQHHLQASKTSLSEITHEKHSKKVGLPKTIHHQQENNLPNLPHAENKTCAGRIAVRKQVRFQEDHFHQKTEPPKVQSSKNWKMTGASKRRKYSKYSFSQPYPIKSSLHNYCSKHGKKPIFEGLKFLVTGMSSSTENDIEGQIWSYGGHVLFDVPSPSNPRGKRNSRFNGLQLPVILCPKKLQTTKFLYGCAVNALLLKVDWLTDCIAAGTILPTEEYMILQNRADMKWIKIGKLVHQCSGRYIFEKVGIMLHGKHRFLTKFSGIIKHGGGRVFKTLQWLVQSMEKERVSVGVIVAEDKTGASRHLKHCASEREIPVMPASWIVKSLHAGKLLSFREENTKSSFPVITIPEVPVSMDLSQEI